MHGLRPREYDRLLEFASAALELPDSPWPFVARRLRDALRGAAAAFNTHTPLAGEVRVLAATRA
jgi:hypothetical protein